MLNRKTFEKLADTREDYCVSIYVPSYEKEDDQIAKGRFERSLKTAEDGLVAEGLSREEALRMLSQAYELTDEDDFWTNRRGTLALFINKKEFHHFTLPYEAETIIYNGPVFYLRPLIAELEGEHRFYLLTITEDEAELYRGNRYELFPANVGNLLPAGVEAALEAAEASPEVAGRPLGGNPAFRPEDFGSENRIKEVSVYFDQINAGIREMLEEEELPLIVASHDHLAALYREVSTYAGTLNVSVSIDPTEADLSTLHEQALSLLEEFHASRREEYAGYFDEAMRVGKASFALTEVLTAAGEGDVSALFLVAGAHEWGAYDKDSGAVVTHAQPKSESIDLLDRAAVQTFLHGGRVYNVAKEELPKKEGKVNAILKTEKKK